MLAIAQQRGYNREDMQEVFLWKFVVQGFRMFPA
jgi:hypothetical protein